MNAALVVKRKVATFLQVHLINPIVRREAGESGSHRAVLETTGRTSGLPRQIPVCDGQQGDVFWVVAHHGRSANFVKNLGANPRVRVKVRGHWRTGSATVMPDDDPLDRLRSFHPRCAAKARQLATNLLTIRVDLDSVSGELENRAISDEGETTYVH